MRERDFAYPVIFYRSIEQQSGSFDNSVAGFDVKANIKHAVQLYGQFLLDEFTAKEFFSHDGYWANKWALQLGGKYFDAFTIKNFDLQAENGYRNGIARMGIMHCATAFCRV